MVSACPKESLQATWRSQRLQMGNRERCRACGVVHALTTCSEALERPTSGAQIHGPGDVRSSGAAGIEDQTDS